MPAFEAGAAETSAAVGPQALFDVRVGFRLVFMRRVSAASGACELSRSSGNPAANSLPLSFSSCVTHLSLAWASVLNSGQECAPELGHEGHQALRTAMPTLNMAWEWLFSQQEL